MVDILLKILLFLSPICYGSNISLDVFDIIFYRSSCVAIFMVSLLDKPKRELSKDFISIILALFGLVFWSIFTHTFDARVMSNSLSLFLGLIALCTVIKYLNDSKSCMKWIVYGASINIVVYLLQYFNINPILNTPGNIDCLGGILGSNVRFGVYLGLVGLLNPVLAIISVLLSIFSKYPQLSTALAISLPFAFSHRQNRRELLLLIIAIVFGIIYKHKHILYSLNFRWNIWYPAIFELCKRPSLGFGVGVMPIKGEYLLNSYLQIIVGLGVSSIVWFVYVARRYYKNILTNSAMMSLVILMLVEPVFEIPRLWLTIMAIIASFVIERSTNEGSLLGT